MRRKQRALDETEAFELLAQARHVTLASTTPDGAPVLRELNSAVVGRRVVFHGAHAGEKTLCLGRRAVVAFSREIVDIPSYFTDAYNACPATAYYESVQAKGTLVGIESSAEKALLLEEMMHHLQPEGGHAPIDSADPRYLKDLRAVRVFALEIDEVTGKRNLGQDKPRETVEHLVERLWRRGGPRDIAAIARILALSPEARPRFLGLPGELEIELSPTKGMLEEAAKFLVRTYWREGQPLEEIVRSHENSTLWLGAKTKDGRIVGFLRALSDSTWRATLMDVFVDPAFRGRGVGRRLVEIFLDHPAIRGVRNIGLETRDKAKFYEHLGFSLHVPRYTSMKWTPPPGTRDDSLRSAESPRSAGE